MGSMTKEFYLKALGAEAKNMRFYQFWKLNSDHSARALCLLRTMQYYRTRGFVGKVVARWCNGRLIKDYGVFIHARTQIGLGLSMPHPNGIVIGAGAEMGDNVTIYQQVTIGSAHQGDWKKGKQPRIGDRVVIFAGAKIIGDITLSDETMVGANAVLLNDTQPGHVYVGVPARATKA